MRKTCFIVMAISLALGLADWGIDAWFDYSTYSGDGSSFLDALIFKMPRTELRSRLLEFSLFILLGTVTCGLLAVRKKAVDQLKEAKDTLERTVAERTRELSDANNQLSTELIRRRLAEQALTAENDFRRTIEDSMNAGVVTVDMEKRITHVNNTFSSMVGWTEQELLRSAPPFPYWPAEKVKEIDQALSNDMKLTGGATADLQFCRRDGVRFDVRVYSSQLRDVQGNQIGLLGVVYDITESRKVEKYRAQAEERYRALVEDMPEMMCRFLPDGTLTFVNTAYCDYFETGKEALVGQNFFQFIPEEARDAVRDRYLSLTHDNPSVTYEHQVLGPRGQMRWQEWTDRALFDADGTIIEFQSIGRDVTERREMLRSLRESGERFRLALGRSPIIVFNQDAGLRYTWIHNASEGFKPETVLGKTDAELLQREDAEKLTEIKRRVLREGVSAREAVSIDVQGETRHYDLVVEPLRGDRGAVIGITCVATDISAYKHEENALRESELRLRQLSFELMTSREHERKRLSVELHDELAQALTLIKFRVRRAKDLMHDDKKTSAEECDLSLEYLDHVIRGVRHLSEELSPPILDDLGLTAGLGRLVEEHRSRSGFNVTSSIMNIDPFLPKPSQIVFYRILEECLENISAHAHARNVSVLVSSLADRIFMHVTDDGIGFDLPRVRMMSSEGSGIAVMEERAKMLGGVLSISSEKDKGTQVALSIPAPAVVQHR